MSESTQQSSNEAENGNKSKPLLSSRLFKFRAWGTKIKWMSKPFSFGQVLNFHDQIIKNLTTDEVVMQFIGEIDKNKKEIYEDDIVKFSENSKIHIVKYINTGFVLTASNGNIMVYNFNPNILEVVGNIYENPELL